MLSNWIDRIPACPAFPEKHPFLDKIFGDALYVKLVYLFCCVIQSVPIVQSYLGGYVKFSLVYGGLVLLYDLFTRRSVLKNRFFPLLALFFGILALSTFVNFDKSLFSNLKTLAYTGLELFVITAVPGGKSRNGYLKEIKTVNFFLISAISLIGLISFITFLFNMQAPYVHNGVTYYYGFSDERRLFGITGNPNTLGIVGALGAALILFHLFCFKPRKGKWVFWLLLAVNFSCSLLSNTRGSFLAFCFFLSVASLFSFLLSDNKLFMFLKFKNLLLRGTVIALALLFSVILINKFLLPVLGYIPPAINYISGTDLPEDPNAPFAPVITVRQDDESSMGGSGRLQLWGTALKIFRHHPFFGVGRAETRDYGLKYSGDEILSGFGQGSVHQIYLQFLASYGIFAALAFICFLIYCIILSIKKIYSYCLSKEKNPVFLFTVSLIAMVLAHGLFDMQILIRVSISGFIFSYYMGVFFSVFQKTTLFPTTVEEK